MSAYTEDDLVTFCEQVFKPHQEMFHMWDSIARNLMPQYATFFSPYYQNYASGLATSTPITMFRDLSDSVGTVLRHGDWFNNVVTGVEEGDEGYDWLQKAKIVMKQNMSPISGFNTSSKIHDKQYQLWGNSPKSITLNKNRDGLLYKTHRLQDVAWTVNYAGQVEAVVRKDIPTYHQASKLFKPEQLHTKFNAKVNSKSDKFDKCDLRHIVMPSEMYGDPEITEEYVAIWFDIENGHKIECIGMNYNQYIISLHFPIPGTPFAFSPIADTALIDARSLQLMTNTLMDAAERYVRPPIIATKSAVIGSLDLTGRAATWVDQDYDERMGDPLRTLDMGGAGAYPIGSDMHDRMVNQLGEDMYKNKLTLPEPRATATEWLDAMEAYRLGVEPILQPVVDNDSAKTCDLTFEILMQNNMFGSPEDIPQSLQGKDVEFEFMSPLTETEDQKAITKYARSLELIANTMGIYPEVKDNFEPNTALRDTFKAQGNPAHWIVPEDVVEKKLAEGQQKQELMEGAAMAEQMAGALPAQ